MNQIIEVLKTICHSPNSSYRKLDFIQSKDQLLIQHLADIALCQDYQQSFREMVLVAFNRYFCKKLNKMNVSQFPKIDELFEIILRLLMSNVINLKMKKTLVISFEKFIDNVGLDIKNLKQILTEAVNSNNQTALFVILDSIFESQNDQLTKIQLINQFGIQIIIIGTQLLEQLTKLTQIIQKKSQKVLQLSYKKILYQLKYLMQILLKLVETFDEKQNITFNKNKRNSNYKEQEISKFIKSKQLGYLITHIIGYKTDQSQLSIICGNDFIGVGFQINELKQDALKCYKEIVKITDCEFNIIDCELQIYFSIPTIIIHLVSDLEKVSSQYERINQITSIQNIIPAIYAFLSQSLKLKDIYEIFYKLNPQSTISIILSYLKTNHFEYELFLENSLEFMKYMDDVMDGSEIVFGKSMVGKFVVKMCAVVDGFISFFFMRCYQMVINILELGYVNDGLDKNIANPQFQSGLIGITLLCKFYPSRRDLSSKVINLIKNINLQGMNEIQQCQVFVFMKYNCKIIPINFLQIWILNALKISEETENQTLCLSACNFIYQVFQARQNIMQIQQDQSEQQNMICFNQLFYKKLQNSRKLYFYITINKLLSNHQLLKKTINKQCLVTSILIKLDKIYQRSSHQQQIKIQIFSIIKNIISQDISHCQKFTSFLFTSSILSNTKSQHHCYFIQIFALMVRGSFKIPQVALNQMASIIIKFKQSLNSEFWVTSIIYLLEHMKIGDIYQQDRSYIYDILINGLAQKEIVLIRSNLVLQTLIVHNINQLYTSQNDDLRKIIFGILNQIYNSTQQNRKLNYSKFTIINLLNTYLLHSTQITINQLRLALSLGDSMANMYNKYTLSVLVEGLFLLIDQYDTFSQQLSERLFPYLQFVTSILQKFMNQNTFISNQDQQLMNVTKKEVNYFSQNDCYRNFHQLIHKLNDMKITQLFEKNLEFQISNLMRVEDIKGKPRTLYKIKHPL